MFCDEIIEGYETEPNYSDDMKPEFTSDSSQFCVTLRNLNYGKSIGEIDSESPEFSGSDKKPAIDPEKVAIDKITSNLKTNKSTKNKVISIFKKYGYEGFFGRQDIALLTGESQTAAGNIVNKLKAANLIEPVNGHGKGKYKFKR